MVPEQLLKALKQATDVNADSVRKDQVFILRFLQSYFYARFIVHLVHLHRLRFRKPSEALKEIHIISKFGIAKQRCMRRDMIAHDV